VRTPWVGQMPVSILSWWVVRAEIEVHRPPPLRAGAAQFVQRRRGQLARCRAGFDQYDRAGRGVGQGGGEAAFAVDRSAGGPADRDRARCDSSAFCG
jgi:hypothetical protein